jgi:hypothetical protein
MRAFDAYCGACIVALYVLYLSVVKGALSVFDCTKNKDGVYILDADPSIVCNKVRRVYLAEWARGSDMGAVGHRPISHCLIGPLTTGPLVTAP